MKIAVVGTGYVGLVLGACLAKLGSKVICVDIDKQKIAKLKKGISPIYEPDLEEILRKEIKRGRLKFSTTYEQSVKESEIIFIAVGTPQKKDGRANLEYVEAAAHEIGKYMNGYKVIVDKSTVPVGTGRKVKKIIAEHYKGNFDVASNPEFLREGRAVYDSFNPDRIVIGTDTARSRDILLTLYEPLDFPKVTTTIESAEMIKYASNAFLATKISFINEIANICEKVGADVEDVSRGMGLDSRIGPAFLKAGIGWGGSCLVGDEEVFLKDDKNFVELLPIQKVVEKIKLDYKKKFYTLSLDIKSRKIKWDKIIKTSERNFAGWIHQIKTKMGKYVSATDDHPFIVYDFSKNKFEVKSANNLHNNDFLPVFTNIPKEKCKISTIDLIKIIKNNEDFQLNKVHVTIKNKKFSQYPGIKPIFQEFFRQKKNYGRTRDVLRSNSITLEEFLSVEEKLEKWIIRDDLLLFTSLGSTTHFPAVINLDPSFCRLIGYFLSEGHINYEKCKRGERARIQFSFNRNEKEYIEDVENILEKNYIKFNHIDKDAVDAINISSRVGAYFLDNVLGCGYDSYSTKFPSVIYGLDSEKKTEMLKGAFRGDGHVAFPKNTAACVYDFGVISQNFTRGAIQLLHSIGIVPSYKISSSKKSTAPAHFFRISSRAQIEKLPNFKDDFTQQRISQRLSEYKKIIKPCGYKKINSDFAVVRINKVLRKKQTVPVFSLETEKYHTFVTSFGLIVHNCFPKDVHALTQIAGTSGYDFKLLKAVVEVNAKQRAFVLDKLEDILCNLKGKKVCVLGLAFKANTDDIRESVAIEIVRALVGFGAKVMTSDPKAIDTAKEALGDGVLFFADPLKAAKGCDALVIATEWPEFEKLDYKKIFKSLKNPILIDGRNLLNPQKMRKLGFKYFSIGRP